MKRPILKRKVQIFRKRKGRHKFEVRKRKVPKVLSLSAVQKKVANFVELDPSFGLI